MISDNAPNMKAMRGEVATKYPLIQVLECSAHGLNLLINDISDLDRYSDIIEATKMIVLEVGVIDIYKKIN